TSYDMAFYVRSLTDWVGTGGANTFDMGYGSGGTDTSCLPTAASVTITAAGWTRVSCFFTTGTLSTSPYLYIKQTDAVARTFYVDAGTLEPDGDASSKWQNGTISLNGVISSPVIIQGSQNSSNSFLVQNSNGTNIFDIDTTDT